MMRCCLSAGAMEAEYLEITRRYTKEELQTFAELLTVFVQEAELSPFSDVFGKTYEEIVSRQKSSAMGQFFTPESICDLTAQMTFNRTILELKLEAQNGLSFACVTFNRTILELKQFFCQEFTCFKISFNRTILELKPINGQDIAVKDGVI